MAPRRYLASVTLLFPEVQDKSFSNLLRALKGGPDRLAGPVEQGARSGRVQETAALVFQSEAARDFVVTGSGAGPRDGLSLTVSSPQDGALRLELESRNDELARQQLQFCLDYYQDFVRKTPLSRSAFARRACDLRLSQLVKKLRQLEEKMSQSAFPDLRRVGDKAIKSNPKVLSELWIKRMEDEGSSRSLLDLMQRVRGSESGGAPEEAAWMLNWGEGLRSGPKPSRGLARPVRRQDLLARAALERDYYEGLLTYRSLVLQRSFLLTCESLESFGFEILDPIRVRTKPKPYRDKVLQGSALAFLFWLLWALVFRQAHKKG